MPTPEKEAVVAELKTKIQGHEIAILSKYAGINVEQVTDLRRRFREAGVDYKVYKNTLAKRALDALELGDVAGFMEGPTAWAFSEDPVAPAKILKEFAREVKFVSMTGGILNGGIVSADQLNALASLPPREQLLAQVAATVAAPLRNLAGVLSALPRDLMNVLEALRKRREAESDATAA